MYYEEKYIQQINECTQRLIKGIEENDIEGAQREHTLLLELFRKELQWIATQVIEGKIRRRK
jgi:hypothetical protein